jgi:hypothetical protein
LAAAATVPVLAPRPELALMPQGNNGNATHRRTCRSLRAIAAQERPLLRARLNQDAKTLGMCSAATG